MREKHQDGHKISNQPWFSLVSYAYSWDVHLEGALANLGATIIQKDKVKIWKEDYHKQDFECYLIELFFPNKKIIYHPEQRQVRASLALCLVRLKRGGKYEEIRERMEKWEKSTSPSCCLIGENEKWKEWECKD